jgi:F-type H+-transporting ATPase subunit b
MISIDIALLFQIVNFLILMLVLNILLYKPLRKILSERDAEIVTANEKTAAVDIEVQCKMALYEARLLEVKIKAGEEKNLALKASRIEEAEIIGNARSEAASSLLLIKARVAGEADSARILLREQAESLSLEICEKVLGRSL